MPAFDGRCACASGSEGLVGFCSGASTRSWVCWLVGTLVVCLLLHSSGWFVGCLVSVVPCSTVITVEILLTSSRSWTKPVLCRHSRLWWGMRTPHYRPCRYDDVLLRVCACLRVVIETSPHWQCMLSPISNLTTLGVFPHSFLCSGGRVCVACW